MNDGQTKDEQADTYQDLEAALLSLESNPTRCGEQQHEREIERPTGRPSLLALALIRQAGLLQAMDRREDAAAAIEEARATIDSCADPRMLAQWLAALERPARTRRPNDDAALSKRELVILRMLTSTLSERDIGRELYLSHNTIHSHTRSIYRKLGASSRTEALANARELGLV